MLPTPAVTLHGVSKDYKIGGTRQRVLHAVELTINQGEFVSIVGPSGSGKTTLAHIIGGLIKPSAGDVVVGTQNLRTCSDRQLSRYRNQYVGFVFQNFSLLPRYTALENVALPLLLAKMSLHERNERAAACLKAVGLGKRLRSFAHQLSGGERQRVAIARALVQNPHIIIADEPTGSLDSKQGDAIADMLQDMQRQYQATLVMVTHNPELAQRADRTLQLFDGVVAQKGVAHAL